MSSPYRKPKRAVPAVKADNTYIKREEHMKCRAQGCRNVIAVWATGPASNGYCTACRGSK